MKGHSHLSPSSADRWLNCPGSVHLSATVPTPPTSPAALEGTIAHAFAEKWLRSGTNADQSDHVFVNGVKYDCNADMAEHVQGYLDYVRGVCKGTGEAYIEQELKLDPIVPGCYGTGDYVVVSPFDSIDVIDLKYGRGVTVEAEDNPQLMIYAIGAYIKFKDYEPFRVRLHIYQPRADHEDGIARVVEYTIDQLKEWSNNVLIPGAKRVVEQPNNFKTGSHCRWCPAAGVCKANAEQSLAIAETSFSAVDSGTVELPDPHKLTVEQVSKILKGASMFEGWVASVRSYALALAESGKEIPAYALKQKYGNRKWIDEKQVAELATRKFGKKAAFKQELKSPAQLEKLKGGKDFVAKHAVKPEAGYTLVLASENNQKVLSKAERLFDPLEGI